MITLALLSDIHGNLPAFEAVAADLLARRPDAVYVLGDMINGCPWSAEVMDRLLDLGWPMLLGNHEDALLQLGTSRIEPRYLDRDRYAALWWTREHLTERHLAVLAALPLESQLTLPEAPPLRIFHGVPGNISVGFRPDSRAEWIAHHLAAIPDGTVAGGHTHVPMTRWISRPGVGADDGRWLVINSGSVGIPFDGDPRASYAWLIGKLEGWQAAIVRVPYDREAVAEGYRQSSLSTEGGVLGEMFLRSAMTALPWVSDFLWWLRRCFGDTPTDMVAALRRYDATHGPGRWAFPLAA